MKGLKGLRIVATLSLIAICSPALACGPTRQKHVESIQIDAPVNVVWRALSNYADMTWHPAIVDTEATSGMQVDQSRRTLKDSHGREVRDVLTRLAPQKKMIGFLTEASDPQLLPVTDYQSIFKVTESAGSTMVEWRGAFIRAYPKPDPPQNLNDEAALRAVKVFQRSGLVGLKQHIEQRSLGGS